MKINDSNLKGESENNKNATSNSKSDEKFELDVLPTNPKELNMWLVKHFGASNLRGKPAMEKPKKPEGKESTYEVTFFPRVPPKKE
jgi:hypothetical protein